MLGLGTAQMSVRFSGHSAQILLTTVRTALFVKDSPYCQGQPLLSKTALTVKDSPYCQGQPLLSRTALTFFLFVIDSVKVKVSAFTAFDVM